MMVSNLLMVDFDYFFPQPLEGLIKDREDILLFDWGHKEGNSIYDQLWIFRAADFIRLGFPLPQVEIPDNWWDRFNITDDAVCEVSDSNMYSGLAGDERVFDHVWLFDAHHDLYLMDTEEQVGKWWWANPQITCENWMWVHYMRGSKLHWRWPRWHTLWKKSDLPRWLKIDARKDDMAPLDKQHMQFDVVSICRSGSWVPPWCDPAFEKFYTSCPVSEIVQVDEVDLVRPWDEQNARQQAETVRAMLEDDE